MPHVYDHEKTPLENIIAFERDRRVREAWFVYTLIAPVIVSLIVSWLMSG